MAKICEICKETEENDNHYFKRHFDEEYVLHIEITDEMNSYFEYAFMICDRAETFLKNNSIHVHGLSGYPSAIRQNIATLKGEVPHKAGTSFGNFRFLKQQVQSLENKLIKLVT